MRLTFTVDIPIRDPESVIDLPKLRQNEDLSYLVLDDQGRPKLDPNLLNARSLSDQSRLLANRLRAKVPTLKEQIQKLKENFPDGEYYQHDFPEGFGMRYPEHQAEYYRAQTKYNMLHNEARTLTDGIEDCANDSIDMAEVVLKLLESLSGDSRKWEDQVAQLKQQAGQIQTDLERRLVTQKSEFEESVTKLRERMLQLSQLCDEKDEVIAEAQESNKALSAAKEELTQKTAQLQGIIDTKLRHSEELSGYVDSLLKNKKELVGQLEARNKEIADLKFKLERREEENRLAIQRFKERLQSDVDRERRRFEGELFKMRDQMAQKQIKM